MSAQVNGDTMSKLSVKYTVAVAVVLAIAAAVCMTTKQSQAAWTVGEPIVTYCGGIDPLTHNMAQLLADGGYNLTRCGMSYMSRAEDYGLRVVLYHPLLSSSSLDGGTLQAQLDAVIDQFKASPAAYSYHIADEPYAEEFEDLAPIVAYLKQRDPDHLAYINLLPLSGPGYETYLSDFSDTVHPQMLSYDYYPFRTTGDIRGYLNNLQMMRAEAERTGVPFMQIVQASVDSWAGQVLRLPTEGELRYQIYSTAAFGAQGISYWRLLAPQGGGLITSESGVSPYWDAETTEIYDQLTPMNKEFVEIVEELQGMQSIGAWMKGYQVIAMPDGMTQLPANSPFDIAEVSNTMVYQNLDPVKGVLFGFFDPDGSDVSDATYALVQNLDYTLNKTYTVNGPGDMSVFNATTGVWTPMGTDEVTVDLLPGGGVLLRLTPTDGVWTNAGGGVWSTASNWSGGVMASGPDVTADFSTLNITSSPTVTLDGPQAIGHLILGDTELSNGWTLSGSTLTMITTTGTAPTLTSDWIATIKTPLGGCDGLTTSGTLNWQLVDANYNTITGPITIADGLLKLTKTGTGTRFFQGVGASFVVESGATLENAGARNTFTDAIYDPIPVTLRGGTLKLTSGDLSLNGLTMNTAASTVITNSGYTYVSQAAWTVEASASGSTVSGSGPLTLTNSGTSYEFNIDVARGAAATDLTINSNIVDHASYPGLSLIKKGSGILALSGTNTYTGKTIVSGGTLRIDAENGLGSNPTTFAADHLTIDGATLQTTADFSIDANRGITISGGSRFSTDSGTTLTVDSGITGSGYLFKTGDGMLVLSGTNTYTGSTSIDAGTLSITSSYLSDVAIVYIDGDASFNLGFSDTDTVDRLYLDGKDAAVGTWGAIGSAADYNTPLITGTGLLNVLNGTWTPMPGDANGDGTINSADAAILATNWLCSSATWSMGDFNGDDVVNDADATLLVANWQVTSSATVPEPSALALLANVLIGLLACVWRKRK